MIVIFQWKVPDFICMKKKLGKIIGFITARRYRSVDHSLVMNAEAEII